MPNHKHLFIIDPIKSLNFALDTSLRLCRELAKIGDLVYVAEPKDLFWINAEPSAAVSAQRIAFKDKSLEALELHIFQVMLLTDFSAIHMRKDPPFDMEYINVTWLLDSAKQKVRIYNAPQALRGLNEKLSIYLFPQESKKAIYSSNVEQLFDYLENHLGGDGILKPIHLYGGYGIIRLNLHEKAASRTSILNILKQETENGKIFRLLQAFDPKVYDGEIRAFSVGGQALAYCLKRPPATNFLANTRTGATLESYTPTPQIEARVNRVATSLVNMGVYFVGFDLIDGHISEINITSPRLLASSDDQTNYFESMVQWIDGDLKKFHETVL